MQAFEKEKTPRLQQGVFSFRQLFAFETVTAGAAFRFFVAGVADVNFSKRAVIARAVVLAFRYAAADAGVDFLIVFVHHIKNPPSKVFSVCVSL